MRVFSELDDEYRYRTEGSSRVALRYERVPYQSSIRGELSEFFFGVLQFFLHCSYVLL